MCTTVWYLLRPSAPRPRLTCGGLGTQVSLGQPSQGVFAGRQRSIAQSTAQGVHISRAARPTAIPSPSALKTYTQQAHTLANDRNLLHCQPRQRTYPPACAYHSLSAMLPTHLRGLLLLALAATALAGPNFDQCVLDGAKHKAASVGAKVLAVDIWWVGALFRSS